MATVVALVVSAGLMHCHNCLIRDTYSFLYDGNVALEGYFLMSKPTKHFNGNIPTTVPVFMILSLKRRWRLPAARIFTMVSSSIFEDDVYVLASSSLVDSGILINLI
jgi:hypothetical protein